MTRPTPEERARTVDLYTGGDVVCVELETQAYAQIAAAIRAAVEEETAAIRADLAKAHDTIRQLADRVADQSEALTRRAETQSTCVNSPS